MRTARLLALLASLLQFLGGPPPAAAELVVLIDGSFFKVSAYALVEDGRRMRLSLPSGGTVTLSMSRIERVVDDEVAPPARREADPLPAPELPWRYEPSQSVPDTPYGELIFEAARRWELNPLLVAAVVRAESAFDPRAVSSKGARGLMQLMPATAHRFGVHERELFEPARNLEAGTFYLRWLLARYAGDLTRALAAYNAGEGTVDRYGGVPPYRETRGYIRRVYAVLGVSDADPAGAR